MYQRAKFEFELYFRSFDDASLAAEKNEINEEMGFSIVIVFLFCIGVLINIGCLISLRRHRSTFHRFLKMLACFDALVVSCIFLMYALPVLAPWYKKVQSIAENKKSKYLL